VAISDFIDIELARLKSLQFDVAEIESETYAACDQFLMQAVKGASH